MPGTAKLVFHVDNLSAEVQRLESLGVRPENPMSWNPEGYRFARFRDLDGYQLELFDWAKAP